MRGLGSLVAVLFAATFVSALPIPLPDSQHPLIQDPSDDALPVPPQEPTPLPELKTPDGLSLRIRVHSGECHPVTVTLDADASSDSWTFACPDRETRISLPGPLVIANAAVLLALALYALVRVVHFARGPAVQPPEDPPRRFSLGGPLPAEACVEFDSRKYCFDSYSAREKMLIEGPSVSMEQEIAGFRNVVMVFGDLVANEKGAK